MSEEQVEDRRGFLSAAMFGRRGPIGAALGIPALGYLLAQNTAKRNAAWIEATDLSKLVVNQPEQVIFQRARRDGWRVITEKASAWVIRTGDQQVVAYSPICTHLGCAVSWNGGEKSFVCPGHTSAFSANAKVM